MKKTLSFAAIHFCVAFSVAYVLTGDVIIGSLIAMLEPMVNTVAFYFHEQAWNRYSQKQGKVSNARIKTATFAVIHFTVAFNVAYLLTGSWLVGGVMALIEPSINTCAYYLHERNWQHKHPAKWHCAH